MSLWEEYNKIHQDFLKRLEIMDEISSKKIIKRLKAEKDKLNFLSTISEFVYFEFFKTNGFSVEYDKKYSLANTNEIFTPDLTINKNGQNIILEVFKLNATKNDLEQSGFINYFFDNRLSIKKDTNLLITLNKNSINIHQYDKDKILNDLKIWLEESHVIGDVFKIDENLQFIIHSLNTGKNNVGFANYSSIEFDISRLNSPNSSLSKKVNKYKNLLDNIESPYLICLIMNIDTAINQTDIFWKIYGDLVLNTTTSLYRSELNGLFYANQDAKKYVSGLLLMINNKFFYFHNFFEKKLNETTKKFLLDFQYYLEDWFPSKQEWLELKINYPTPWHNPQ